MSKVIKKIVIVGGGTAGWMTAAALSKLLGNSNYQICLVESDQIGTVGVGEATLPHLRFFNQRLGIPEDEFMRATHATFKAGIEFSNWGALGDAYIHPFGDYGSSINKIAFHHYWLKARGLGLNHKIDEYSFPVKFCQAGKFDFPSEDIASISSTYSYAYHIDAGLYAKFLRGFSEKLGLQRIEGRIDNVCLSEQNGEILNLQLEGGQVIEGDFFIDCSGFRSLLLGGALEVPFESWRHWLPCDRAVAAPTENNDTPPLPYTKATAYEAGWQWRIPLQHRTGNGHVYASQFMEDDQAEDLFRQRVSGELIREPIKLRFEAGARTNSWQKNCVAIGLSAGFLEPLESTSIYLVQIAIMKFMEFFSERCNTDEIAAEFNRQMRVEYERTRDFLILHYHATERRDTDFWQYVSSMDIPSSLQHKMALFKSRGYVSPYAHGLFLEPSWIAVYLGQRYFPDAIDPRVAAMPETGLLAQLEKFRERVVSAVDAMPQHQEIIDRVCSESYGAANNTAAMSLYGATRNG